jgi:hypothetical protein
LCFSAGEGLRLTPFPVFGREAAEATNKQLQVIASNEISTRYSPTIVSTRPLNRGLQHVVEYGNPPAQSSRELPAQPFLLRSTDDAPGLVSLFLNLPIPSRAPPFAS